MSSGLGAAGHRLDARPRANLVRQIQITACFQVLVTGMTRRAFAGGIASLCMHLDWYGKLVLGWELSLHPDTPLALASLQMAFAAIIEWKGGTLEGLIVHQDQGSPSTSGDDVTAVLERQAFVSYSRPATPGDNPVNESFFSRFKAEWVSKWSRRRPSRHCASWSAGRWPMTTRRDIIRVLGVKHSLSLPNSSWIVSHLRTRKWFPLWGQGPDHLQYLDDLCGLCGYRSLSMAGLPHRSCSLTMKPQRYTSGRVSIGMLPREEGEQDIEHDHH